MNLFNSFLESLSSLGHNFLRTFLTILGVVVGVMAVIVMLSVGQGVQEEVNEKITSIGSNLLVVFPNYQTSSKVKIPGTSSVSLTLDDARALSNISSIDKVAPVISKSFQVQFQDVNWRARVSGITPDYNYVREWNLINGYYLSSQDVKSSRRVALIGKTVVRELFGRINPIDKVIRIQNIPFKVIGILDKKGSSLTGRDQDNSIFVPFSTARKFLIKSVYPKSVSYLILKVKNKSNLESSEKEVKNLLRIKHKIRKNEKNDFSVSNLADISSTAETATNALTILLASIASVSLIVGGIGIMNIMLVSVTERTREIGIRLALGAREKDILNQFLIESSIVCMIGGIMGIFLGVTCSWLIATFTEVMVRVSLSSIVLSFTISVLIGIFFGWYPAKRASKMQPVDALRIE